jgi:hypothetical protein
MRKTLEMHQFRSGRSEYDGNRPRRISCYPFGAPLRDANRNADHGISSSHHTLTHSFRHGREKEPNGDHLTILTPFLPFFFPRSRITMYDLTHGSLCPHHVPTFAPAWALALLLRFQCPGCIGCVNNLTIGLYTDVLTWWRLVPS